MCGIVGYVGNRPAAPLLLEGLARLEYRGYDSAGLALLDGGRLAVEKTPGRLSELENRLAQHPLGGSLGIGHTRWATHGEPSQCNAHPHQDGAGLFAVVHNGIIENYLELRRELEAEGHAFLSQTDTEVLPHLIAREFAAGGQVEEAIRRALSRARGAYAVGIVHRDSPDVFYAARKGSPLIIGLGRNENFIASDVPAILKQVQRVIYLNDGEVAAVRADRIDIHTLDGRAVEPVVQDITLRAEAADRAGFETYMLKEIHEQPRVLRELLREHVNDERLVDLQRLGFDPRIFSQIERIMLISCGTAYYASCYGKLLFEHYTSLPAETDLASEFRYRSPKIDARTLVIPVSQSGETADTLASVRLAREKGCPVLSICNVPGSSLVRESDGVFFIQAGPEIGVASTKAYTAQLMAFALIALAAAKQRGEMGNERMRTLVRDLEAVPDAIHYILSRTQGIQAIAEKHHDGPSALYLGRRFNYPTAMEGALKNKEISYQHAEAYAAGEMKHGPIALINEYMPVVCICTRTEDELYEKMMSNVKEVEARHGRLIIVATDGDESVRDLTEDVIHVPAISEAFSPLVNVVALQLLAYYAAQARGTDIDKPRNLAKSVTVE